MTTRPGLVLYPWAGPLSSRDLPDGFDETATTFQAATATFAGGDFRAAARQFLESAREFRRCAVDETGVRTLSYWNALIAMISAGDVESAHQLGRTVSAYDEVCGPAVVDLLARLVGDA
jgi:hypothetical protein